MSWAKAKVKQGVAFVKAKAKQGVDFVKGKVGGLFGKKKEEGEKAKPSPEDVQGAVAHAVQQRIGTTLPEPARTQEIIGEIYDEFQPHGLKQLYLEPVPGKLGAFAIKTVASPPKTVKEALASLKLRVSDLVLRAGTWCTAQINGTVVKRTDAEGGIKNPKESQHAEELMIEWLRENWESQAPDKSKRVNLVLQVKRSPCGPSKHDCAGQLEQFFRELKVGRGYAGLHHRVQSMTLYEGRGSGVIGESFISLEELKRSGTRVEYLDVMSLLEQKLGRPLEEGEIDEETRDQLDRRLLILNDALEQMGSTKKG